MAIAVTSTTHTNIGTTNWNKATEDTAGINIAVTTTMTGLQRRYTFFEYFVSWPSHNTTIVHTTGTVTVTSFGLEASTTALATTYPTPGYPENETTVHKWSVEATTVTNSRYAGDDTTNEDSEKWAGMSTPTRE